MVTLNTVLSIMISIVLAGPVLGADGPNGLIAVLTDYGNADYYIGTLEGAIYSVSTDVKVSTITNEVWPFDVPDGAFMLYEASKAYPPGTTFIAVVDPGVGTERMPIVLKTKDGKYFVGPDNGLLDIVANKLGVDEVRRITNQELMRKDPGSTMFHGRDVFGPVAAHIATGTPLEKVGPNTSPEQCISIPEPTIQKDGQISGDTLYVDHYGNITTNIEPTLLDGAGIKEGDILAITVATEPTFTVEGGGEVGDVLTIQEEKKQIQARYSKAYGDVPKGAFVCLVNTAGFLELAVNQGSFVKRLNLAHKPGITIKSTAAPKR